MSKKDRLQKREIKNLIDRHANGLLTLNGYFTKIDKTSSIDSVLNNILNTSSSIFLYYHVSLSAIIFDLFIRFYYLIATSHISSLNFN